MASKNRTLGIVLLLTSALIFSTAGPFIKGVEASAWAVVFWRGLFAALFTTAFVLWRGSFAQDFTKMGKWGLVSAFLGALGSAAFIAAFKHTDIANVALIYACAPMLAAFFAWLWMRERMSRAVLIGSVAALAGVLLIVNGSFNSVNLTGDLLALWMTIIMSIIIVLYRCYPDTPGAGPLALSCIILLPVAVIFGEPFHISQSDMLITACFGLVFAVASVALVEGAKHLPSGETALLSALESPFAIILAWMLFSEVPVLFTIYGGLLILIGVIVSQTPYLLQRKNANED